jgi:nucleotide-binding universal stress UspA family protein
MITINRILVPTDLSIASVPTVGYALALAKAHHAELSVLHVLSTDVIKDQQLSHGYPEGLAAAPGTPSTIAQPNLDDLFERKKQLLRTFLDQRLGTALVKTATLKPVIRLGKVVEEIVATAKEEQCDLIVTANQASRLRSLFRGRFSDQIAREAPCPVLLIPSSANVTTDKNERVPLTQLDKWAA